MYTAVPVCLEVLSGRGTKQFYNRTHQRQWPSQMILTVMRGFWNYYDVKALGI